MFTVLTRIAEEFNKIKNGTVRVGDTLKVNGKTENQLDVLNAAKLGGKTESQLNVKGADVANKSGLLQKFNSNGDPVLDINGDPVYKKENELQVSAAGLANRFGDNTVSYNVAEYDNHIKTTITVDTATALKDTNNGVHDYADILLSITSAIDALKDNVSVDGNTLSKLRALIGNLETIVASNDSNLNTLQEVIDFIKVNRSSIETLFSNKINTSDIIDNLTTNLSSKVLSAKQGYILDQTKVNILDIIDNLTSTNTNKPLSAYQGKILYDTITNLNKVYLSLSGGTLTGPLVLSQSPTSDMEAATKLYVDSAGGFQVKDPVVVATTSNISDLRDLKIIDGIQLVNGDRVLVKDQNNAAENGIYIAENSTWGRASDMNSSSEFANASVFVQKGSVNAGSIYIQITRNVTLGLTNIIFKKFSNALSYSAGNGLTLSNSTFSLNDTFSSPGSYTKVTIDSTGRVSSGTNPTLLSEYGIIDAINSSEKGIANGIATLDENGLLTNTQIPTITKDTVGLDQVDNTSDLNKPISTATQLALDAKNSLVSQIVIDSNTTEFNFQNLNDNNHGIYTINFSLISASATDMPIMIEINGDTVTSNYRIQSLLTEDTITTSERKISNEIFLLQVGASISGEAHLMKITNKPKLSISAEIIDTNLDISLLRTVLLGITDISQISSIRIFTTNTDGFQIGSSVSIWKNII